MISLPIAVFAQTPTDSRKSSNQSCDLEPGKPGTVAEVVDGDTLILADGRVIRMAGIEAPKQVLARPGSDVEEVATASRAALEALASGARIEIRLGENPRDRHNRTLGQLYLADGSWLQEAMIEAGFARIRSFAGEFSCLARLLGREQKARTMGLGLWRNDEFSVISAHDPSLIERKGLYVLVEGRILSVGRGNRVDFLNFGRIWRRDFTVLVSASVAKRLTASGQSIEGLAERRVRVRGVIEESGGPAIRLNDPGEIEVLDDD